MMPSGGGRGRGVRGCVRYFFNRYKQLRKGIIMGRGYGTTNKSSSDILTIPYMIPLSKYDIYKLTKEKNALCHKH